MSEIKMLDAEILTTFRELQADDPEFMPNYYNAFLTGLPPHVAGITEALATKDAPKLAHHAHAIKSSCSNSGVVSIVAPAGRMEDLGKSGSTVGAEADFEEVKRLIPLLKAEIYSLPEMAGQKQI